MKWNQTYYAKIDGLKVIESQIDGAEIYTARWSPIRPCDPTDIPVRCILGFKWKGAIYPISSNVITVDDEESEIFWDELEDNC